MRQADQNRSPHSPAIRTDASPPVLDAQAAWPDNGLDAQPEASTTPRLRSRSRALRVHELIAQHSIPWPPPIVTSGRPSEKVPVASEVRQAILEGIYWQEDDAGPAIDLHLQLHGRMVTAALVCARWQKQVYQDLFWALQRGLGRTLAEVENFEVAL